MLIVLIYMHRQLAVYVSADRKHTTYVNKQISSGLILLLFLAVHDEKPLVGKYLHTYER